MHLVYFSIMFRIFKYSTNFSTLWLKSPVKGISIKSMNVCINMFVSLRMAKIWKFNPSFYLGKRYRANLLFSLSGCFCVLFFLCILNNIMLCYEKVGPTFSRFGPFVLDEIWEN